jgi:hypothetical protein
MVNFKGAKLGFWTVKIAGHHVYVILFFNVPIDDVLKVNEIAEPGIGNNFLKNAIVLFYLPSFRGNTLYLSGVLIAYILWLKERKRVIQKDTSQSCSSWW